MTSRPPRHHTPRPYHRHGLGLVTKALPYLMQRVTDPALPDADLSPVERAARDWRASVIQDLGGLDGIPAAKVALLDAATGSKVILDSLDCYVFELAATGGLVSRRNRAAFRVVADRMRVADGLARQLQALGLERGPRRPVDLASYLAARDRAPERASANETATDGRGDGTAWPMTVSDNAP